MSPSRVQPWSQPGDDAFDGPHELPKPRAVGATTAKPCFAKNQFVYLSAGFVLSNAVFVWPRPCSRRIVGKGPSPVAGSVTSTSIGVPSKLAGRDARSGVGQKRTPFWGVQAWPKGAGSAATAAEVGTSASSAAAAPASSAARGTDDMARTLTEHAVNSARCGVRRIRARQEVGSGPMLGPVSDLERRLAVPYGVLMIGSNLIGAAIVFALIRWVLPLPPVDDPGHVQRVNVLALAAYLVFAVPAGLLCVLWLLRPVLTWLRADRPPTAGEQRAVLLTPAREVLVHGALWALGAVVFTIINLAYSHDLALIVAITVALAGAATCAVAYLLAQRVLRPVAARALADQVPERPELPGIAARILLTYILGTGVPVLGIPLAGAGVLTGVLDASSDRVATTALLLGGV